MMGRTNIAAILLLLLICLPAEGWSWTKKINGTARAPEDVSAAVAFTWDGDVFASGMLEHTGTGKDFTLIKYDGATGREMWRRVINGTANLDDYAGSVVTDSRGNPFVIGYLEHANGLRSILTVIFNGMTGEEISRWETAGTAPGGKNEGRDVEWDRDDNIISAVSLDNIGTGPDFGVIKFNVQTGEELWRVEVNGTADAQDESTGVVTDEIGRDIYASGFVTNVQTGRDMFVIRVDGETGQEVWRVVVNGTANGDDEAFDLGADFFGNFFLVGKIENIGTGADFIVIKYNGTTGEEIWRNTIDGTAHQDDMAFVVVIDPDGNPIAAGYTTNVGTGRDFTVIKFDALTGGELWRVVINGSAEYSRDEALAMEIDPQGDPVVTGFITNEGTGEDYIAMKIDGATGKVLWTHMVNGTANKNDRGESIMSDTRREYVYTTGMTTNLGTGQDFTVLKLDGITGEEVWRNVTDGTAPNSHDEAVRLFVTADKQEDIIAAGRVQNMDTEQDFLIVKFRGADGTELWRYVINGTANRDDSAHSVLVDAQADILAAGYITNIDTAEDLIAVKLDGATGEPIWRTEISGTAPNSKDAALSARIDAQDNLIAVGRTNNVASRSDFTIVKFDGETGQPIWRTDLDGTAHGNDQANELVIDSQGNLIVVGYTTNLGSGRNFTVVKLNGNDGAEMWRTIVVGGGADDHGQATHVGIDTEGNIFAAGFIVNADTQEDFLVIKIDPITGDEIWHQVINGLANKNDQAKTIIVDRQGNPIAAGFETNTATKQDFAVIKFDGITGQEIWRREISGSDTEGFDEALDLALDDQMNVIAAGKLENYRTRGDFSVIKLDGTTGQEIWRVVINGDINRDDSAYSVTTDRAGNAIAVGFVTGRDRGPDFTIVKRSSENGDDF